MNIGAHYTNKNCEFTVWAPNHDKVSLLLTEKNESIAMQKARGGYWKLRVEGIKPATKYLYQIANQAPKPDPASHYQPEGVFGSSAVVDHEAFRWKDSDWQGIPLEELVFYELHVGTFTREGNFKAISERLGELAELGVNAVELMPVTQFSGGRNWGYDSVFPYAVHNTYGTPDDLKGLVECCHVNGLAMFLDIIYNHVGPEGAVLKDFGPYFRENRKTPWGPSLNFDGPDCAEVRRFFFENALHWFKNYHVDGVRLDAVHAIMDTSQKHFLKELSETVDHYSEAAGRKVYLVAETNQNDPVVVRSRRSGGYGLDAQWLDDFHHALHVLLTKEKKGYYMDYGGLSDLVASLNEGYIYTGQFSRFWQANRGHPPTGVPPCRFVVFTQNHDQTGNRAFGERLITLAGQEAAKLAATLVAFSPYLPLLFMGEEYGETVPFLYFTDFQDKTLAENVQKGRREEHKESLEQGEIPDPQNAETFSRSQICWETRREGNGKRILGYYRMLLRLRKELLAQFGESRRMNATASDDGNILFMRGKENSVVVVANFSKSQSNVSLYFKGEAVKVLDSSAAAWGGPGSLLPQKAADGAKFKMQPLSAAVYVKPELVKKLV